MFDPKVLGLKSEKINIIQPPAEPEPPPIDYLASLISANKAFARAKIEAIAPQYKQINLLRENPNAPEFAQIDAIRAKSNEIEAQILAAQKIEQFDLLAAWGN